MQAHKVDDGYLLVLKKGERIIKTVTDFCTEHKVQAGSLVGIGAMQSATLGYYYLKQQRYKHRRLNKLMEIASLSGNVTLDGGKPSLHIHTVLSDSKLRAVGGHLKEATVGGTCEIHLRVYKNTLERQTDPDTGLNLIK